MASPPTGLKALNGKHYLIAALMVVVAAAVVVTVFFIVLSPVRIIFSVTKASSYHLVYEGEGLNFTLAANNTSHRAAVNYQSLFVEVANNTALYETRANMNTTGMAQWHPPGSVATVDATVSLLGEPWIAFFDGNETVGDATVLVMHVIATARFKVAGIRTRQSPDAPPVGCSPV